MKFRRLTRDEATRAGVSYGSKHQVAASVPKGKATARSKLYTNRQYHEALIKARARALATSAKERRAASKQTKEKYSGRRNQTYTTKHGKEVKVFNDLSKKEFFRRVKRAHGRNIVPHFLAERHSRGASGTHGEPKWSSGTQIAADELDNDEELDFWLEQWGFTSDPVRYGLQIVSQ